MTLYSSSFTAKPRYAVNVEYSMPSECGNRISRSSVMSAPPSGAPLAVADRERRPLADAVGGQDRRAPRRRGEKGGGRVRLVVAGEQDLRPRHAEMRRDDAAHPDLFAERVLDRVRKGSPGARKRPQRAGEDPIELQHAALVEDHRVEIGRLEAGVIQAPFDGAERKAASFLCRDRRSSCTAQTGTPSTTSAAAESW